MDFASFFFSWIEKKIVVMKREIASVRGNLFYVYCICADNSQINISEDLNSLADLFYDASKPLYILLARNKFYIIYYLLAMHRIVKFNPRNIELMN